MSNYLPWLTLVVGIFAGRIYQFRKDQIRTVETTYGLYRLFQLDPHALEKTLKEVLQKVGRIQ